MLLCSSFAALQTFSGTFSPPQMLSMMDCNKLPSCLSFLHGRLDAITCSRDLIAPVDEEAIFHFSTAEKKNGS